MAEVVGVGALNWDRLYRVDRFAAAGEEIVIKDVREEAGGSAANTIAGLGRLGVECGFVGKIGNDPEGRNIITAFKEVGVDTRGIVKVEGRTGSVLAFVDDTGERIMYVNPGVNDTLLPKDINIDYIKSARYLHVSSFAGETSINAIKKIPEIKGTAKLSFAPGFLCWRGLDFLMPLLKDCGILFLNEKEANALTAAPPHKAGGVLMDIGVGTVVVTLGERGCLVIDEEGVYDVEGIKARAVDTTGAGDAFAAGFLFGVLNGFHGAASGKLGNFVASRCIEHVGARKGLPKIGGAKAFLEGLS
ncbi:MAG: carbohydrate kinase family protein [Candidatus Hydrothermarchaeales archaeon]